MAGDVFGNVVCCYLSTSVYKLHLTMHIFIDPNPDSASSCRA
ncbi:NAD-glutamate dehydrogenase [Vibrio chagasii]|nr:NAD-glutamate dehydrogenase [Vibrio chagasii]